MEINLRKELVDWLKRRGHWGVLRSVQTGRRSGAVDSETGQAHRLGTGTIDGKPYVDYLVKIDRGKKVPDISLDLPIADVTLGADHIYLQHHMPVKENDEILEIELDTNGEPIVPIRIREVYRILDPEDMRDGAGLLSGRIEFYQCRVEKVSARTDN